MTFCRDCFLRVERTKMKDETVTAKKIHSIIYPYNIPFINREETDGMIESLSLPWLVPPFLPQIKGNLFYYLDSSFWLPPVLRKGPSDGHSMNETNEEPNDLVATVDPSYASTG